MAIVPHSQSAQAGREHSRDLVPQRPSLQAATVLPDCLVADPSHVQQKYPLTIRQRGRRRARFQSAGSGRDNELLSHTRPSHLAYIVHTTAQSSGGGAFEAAAGNDI